MINFINGLATLKNEATIINEEVLRQTKVYAKLMLSKGTKFEDVKDRSQFLLSESGEFIRAELFVINKQGTAIYDNRFFVNVSKDAAILANSASRMYYVELLHPTVDLTQSVLVDF